VGVIHPLPQLFSNALNEGAKMNPKKYDGLVGYQTYSYRIKHGWTEEAAKNTLPKKYKTLNMADVIDVEAYGLSISRSAVLLDTPTATLRDFIKRHKITWRGQRSARKKGVRETGTQIEQIEQAGVNAGAVYTQMYRNQIDFKDALEKVIRLQKTRHYLTKEQSDYIMENYKKDGCKAVAKHLGLPADRVKCKYNYVMYKQRKVS